MLAVRPEQVVGTGAFKAKSYDTGVGWSLVKNPNYFKKGKPYLDRLIVKVVPDDNSRMIAFEAKDSDYVSATHRIWRTAAAPSRIELSTVVP